MYNAFYAQSGGVTAVINASACGLIETARRHRDKIAKVYAGRHGIIGALTEDMIDTSKESRAAISALEKLPKRPDAVLLDGSHDYIGRPWPVRCAVRADLRSVSVAAASVIAKVHRDRFMAGLGHPEFAFGANAGYPSPVHTEALAALGPTPEHRLSWSYLDDLPQWRHLRKHRPDIEGQLSLL